MVVTVLVSTALIRTPVPVVVTSGRGAGVVVSVFIASSFWKRKVSDGHRSDGRTHVKDPKDIAEVQSPGSDRLFIFLCIETPEN